MARPKTATCFDMRKRILAQAEDASRIHGKLGSLPNDARLRMNEGLLAAGDVAPLPASELRAGVISPT